MSLKGQVATDFAISAIPMFEPMVSVIIPVWGIYKKYLPECLEDLNKQTYKNFETIVVDDCTDLPTARNKGISKAKGKYIICLDVDDKLHHTYIERCLKEDNDIVGTAYVEFGDSNGVFLMDNCKYPVLEDFLNGNRMPCSAMFKKKIWEDIGGYDENMKIGLEDWDFWLRAVNAGYTVSVIKEPLFFYNKHGKSMIDDANEIKEDLYNYIIKKLYSVI